MVRDFIRKNRCLWNGKSVFCLNTMGLFSGDGTGCAARLLKKYGAQILGGVQIKMPDSVCDNKQKNGESNSAAHKSRTEPAQYIVVVKLDGSTQKAESIEHEGIIYDRTDHVEFDLDSVPDYVRERLAAATLECYREFIKKPGAIELLDKKMRERKAAKN